MEIKKVEDIGRTVASMRRANGMKQAALAKAASVSRETVSRLETGHYIPSLPSLVAIVGALGGRVVIEEGEG